VISFAFAFGLLLSPGLVDEDGFRLALKEVKASKDDTTILLSWYGWIAAEVFVNRFHLSLERGKTRFQGYS